MEQNSSISVCLPDSCSLKLLAGKPSAAEERKRYDKRNPLEAIVAAAASAVRERFWTDGAIAEDAHIRLEITETFGAKAFAKVLVILGQAPNEPRAVAVYRRASEYLVDCWMREFGRANGRRDRNFESEQSISYCLQEFVMRVADVDAAQVLQNPQSA